MAQVPAASIVTVAPLTPAVVQIAGDCDVKVTASADVAVAATLKMPPLLYASVGGFDVIVPIVWSLLLVASTKVCTTCAAAL